MPDQSDTPLARAFADTTETDFDDDTGFSFDLEDVPDLPERKSFPSGLHLFRIRKVEWGETSEEATYPGRVRVSVRMVYAGSNPEYDDQLLFDRFLLPNSDDPKTVMRKGEEKEHPYHRSAKKFKNFLNAVGITGKARKAEIDALADEEAEVAVRIRQEPANDRNRNFNYVYEDDKISLILRYMPPENAPQSGGDLLP